MHTYITVRTPFRVSFLGGGTDYPEYFQDHPAAVLGMAINRYIYLTALRRPAFHRHEFTIAYSVMERVTSIRDIQHPAVRVALEAFEHTHPLDVSTLADLPSQSGLGSSGSFMVGLINLLSRLNERPMEKLQIAQMAIDLERGRLKHVCGIQDQLHAAFGGLNYFNLSNGTIGINPVRMAPDRLRYFLNSMVLVFTGQTRSAPTVLKEQMERTQSGQIDRDLHSYYQMAQEGMRILEDGTNGNFVSDFGKLMHEGWLRKCQFSASITNSVINDLYAEGRRLGAYGGKLCGAGGGGFILFVVPPERRQTFIAAFDAERILEVDLDTQGSMVLTMASTGDQSSARAFLEASEPDAPVVQSTVAA